MCIISYHLLDGAIFGGFFFRLLREYLFGVKMFNFNCVYDVPVAN